MCYFDNDEGPGDKIRLMTLPRYNLQGLQGIRGSGLYALSQVALVKMRPIDKPGLIGALVGVTLTWSLVLRPIIGGLISHLST
ncbi:hypothetical protein jhhlp_000560 [Lomentospora prolificans]|uniref:Uncharacterized protein n=1 Tax=Lomentospora prolificans TaxID=41688 RepID=A0A2N3NLA5_9PEZI|nr:hypothetical protein jhhlp_000560 [Lomentospora prolificans]